MRKFLPACFLFVLIASTGGVAAKDKSFEHQFNTRVSVDATGRVTDVEFVKETPAALQAMVREVASLIPFEPATRDGVAVPSRTSLQLGVAFTPDGDNYQAKVVSVGGGSPASVTTTLPRFPASVLRKEVNMVAMVVVRPRADGTTDPAATSVETLQFYRGEEPIGSLGSRPEREMRDAIVAAAGEWTYILEEVDGAAITTELRVPLTLCVSKRMSSPDHGRNICAKWSKEAMDGLSRPEPVDPAIRLAQPRWAPAAAPTA